MLTAEREYEERWTEWYIADWSEPHCVVEQRKLIRRWDSGRMASIVKTETRRSNVH